jgi:hypothetical protein
VFEINADRKLCPLVTLTFESAIGEPLLVMLTVPCVLVDPIDAVSVSGFGLATRPDVPPLPTVRVTVKEKLPFTVATLTVPVSLPLPKVRLVGVTVTKTLDP